MSKPTIAALVNRLEQATASLKASPPGRVRNSRRNAFYAAYAALGERTTELEGWLHAKFLAADVTEETALGNLDKYVVACRARSQAESIMGSI